MYSFVDFHFWFFALLFLFAVLIVFFLPGYTVIRSIHKLSSLQSFLLSIVLGLVLWGIQGYILGYLQLRFLSFVYVGIWILYGIRQKEHLRSYFIKVWKEVNALDRGVCALLLVGLLLQILPMVLSGMRFHDGVRYYFINATDGVMHLSYIQSLIRSFPPSEPGAVGLPLVNYHYWSDLVIAELSRIFSLPVSHLFFQYFPFLLSLLTGLAVYFLIKAWGGTVVVARFALFLLYFGGDAAYLIYFLIHQTLSFHTPAIDNGVTQFFNMPHAFAKVIFLSGLITLHQWVHTRSQRWGMITIIFFASLFGFKIYYGLFAAFGFSLLVAGLFIRSFITLLRKERVGKDFIQSLKTNRTPILLLSIFSLLAALIYFPTNSGAGGLTYSPLEWPKLLLGEEALNFREWWLRQQVYEQAGNTRNVVIMNIIALVIAFISIHGTRLLGFLPTKTLLRNLRLEGILFLIPGIILFTFLGFFTLQESGLFNVFNFFVVTLVILSLFAAFPLSVSWQKSGVGKIVVILFILLTLPRVVFETGSFITAYVSDNYRLISNAELEGLSFLKNNTSKESVIQSHPDNSLDNTTPYVSFFTNRPTYFTGGGLLATHNQPVEERQKALQELFEQPNANEFAENMKALGIDYVYLQKKDEEKVSLIDGSPHLKTAFENKGVIIYQYVR